MAFVRTTIKVSGTDAVYKRMAGMEKRSQDFSSALKWAQRELEEAHKENFATGGALVGGWRSLDNEYARWKLAHYGPLPTLIREGDLYREATNFRGAPNDIRKKSATFGLDLPYAKFHQAGTSKMAQRKVIFVPPLFAKRLGQLVLNYVVYGKSTEVSTARLRHMLTT